VHNLSLLMTFAGGLAAALALGFLAHKIKVSPIVAICWPELWSGPSRPATWPTWLLQSSWLKSASC